jgi:hypothetical protein
MQRLRRGELRHARPRCGSLATILAYLPLRRQLQLQLQQVRMQMQKQMQFFGGSF